VIAHLFCIASITLPLRGLRLALSHYSRFILGNADYVLKSAQLLRNVNAESLFFKYILRTSGRDVLQIVIPF